jgi:hypothetical protein
MLRHSSVAITADTYTEVMREVSTELAEQMTALVPRLRAVAGDRSDTAAHTSPTQLPSPARKGDR